MTDFFSRLFLYTAAIAGAVVIGGIVPLWIVRLRRYLHLFLSFSAGIMLGAALIHLLPEAIELVGAQAPLWTLAGFLFLYAFEKFVTVHICEALECEVHTVSVSALVGISAHSFADGIALGSGLLVPHLGLIVALTIFCHKLPEAFALTSILLHQQHGRARIALFNALLIAMVPLGALLVYALLDAGQSRLTGVALAFSAGTFLHISLSDLLPEVHKYLERKNTIFAAFLFGLGAMYLLHWGTHG